MAMTRTGLPSSLYGISVQAFFHSVPETVYFDRYRVKVLNFTRSLGMIRNVTGLECAPESMLPVELEDPESDQEKQGRCLLFSLQALFMT